MKMPWHNQTGLAKAATICAIGFVISSGLCGLNVLFASNQHDYPGGFLVITAFLEAGAMAIFALCLLVIALDAIVKRIAGAFFHKPEGEQ